MNVGTLTAFLKLDRSQYSSGIQQAKKEADQMDKQLQQMEGATKSAGAALSNLGALAMAAATAFGVWKLAGFIKETAIMAGRFETMGAVMNVVGSTAGYTAEQMNDLEKQLHKTGIAHIEAREVLVRMTQAQLDLTEAHELARVAQDAAVIGNVNSSAAFERMILGIQTGNTRILRGIGLQVNFTKAYDDFARSINKTTSALSEQEKIQARANAVKEAGSQIVGAYEASMTTAGKQLLSMQRHIDNFKVSFGETFGPSMKVIVETMTDSIKKMQAALDDMKESGELHKWAMRMADGVLGAIDIMIRGFIGLGLAVTHVRAAFGFWAEKWGSFRESAVTVGLERSIERAQELKDLLAGPGWELKLHGGEDQVRSQLAAVEKTIAKQQQGQEEYRLLAEAGREMYKDNILKADEYNEILDKARASLAEMRSSLTVPPPEFVPSRTPEQIAEARRVAAEMEQQAQRAEAALEQFDALLPGMKQRVKLAGMEGVEKQIEQITYEFENLNKQLEDHPEYEAVAAELNGYRDQLIGMAQDAHDAAEAQERLNEELAIAKERAQAGDKAESVLKELRFDGSDAMRTLEKQMEDRRNILDEALALEYFNKEEHEAAMTELERAGSRERQKILESEAAAREQAALSTAASIVSITNAQVNQMAGLYDQASSIGKAFFLMSQGLAAANAIINGFQSAMAIRVAYATMASTAGYGAPAILAAGNVHAGVAQAMGFATAGMIAAQTVESFEGGGFTGYGPRTGGEDGKGGRWAIVHPNEMITDLTKPHQTESPMNLRIVNVLDPKIVESWATSPNGEKVIMNVIRRNQ